MVVELWFLIVLCPGKSSFPPLSFFPPDGRKAAGAPPPNADANIVWRSNVRERKRGRWGELFDRSKHTNHPALPPPPPIQDFPYNFAPGIAHYNVWCTRPLPPPELTAVVERHAPSATHDAVAFVNPAALASIPSVWHAHVLVRAKGGE